MVGEKINLSLKEEIENTARAIQRVTAAAFKSAGPNSSSIGGKKKSAQFTFRMNDPKRKRSVQSIARRQLTEKAFREQAVRIENEIRRALNNVIIGLVGRGSPTIKVMSRSLGSAKPSRPLDSERFVAFIKSPGGAGEIGLPDPNESIRNLKIALLASISVDVVVRSKGPQIKFRFDQRKLLKMTPHPDVFESGGGGAFFSWLSLVTGPDFVRNIRGHSLVRVGDIKAQLNKLENKNSLSNRPTMRPARALNNLIRISRTRGNAGDLAGLMLSNQRGKGQSPAEFAGGSGMTYRPSGKFNGFWDEYWFSMKQDLRVWGKRVMSAAIRGVLRR